MNKMEQVTITNHSMFSGSLFDLYRHSFLYIAKQSHGLVMGDVGQIKIVYLKRAKQ
jgi:hypothetical protein